MTECHVVWACSVSKSVTYQLLKPQLDVVLFEIIFPLMCFNDADDQLWREDPHEYVRKGYGESTDVESYLLGVGWLMDRGMYLMIQVVTWSGPVLLVRRVLLRSCVGCRTVVVWMLC